MENGERASIEPGQRRASRATGSDHRQLLLQNLHLIDRTARILGMRHGLQPADLEDFASEVKLAFVADDYRVVRAFRGESRFSTYVVSVVKWHYSKWRRDSGHRDEWRPSKAAQRLGLLAMEAEELLSRDGLTFEEAFQTLTISRGWSLSRLEFAELVPKIRIVPRRSFVPLDEIAVPASSDDHDTTTGMRQILEHRTSDALAAALAALDRRSRLAMVLRFGAGLNSTRIGATLGLSRHQEYRLRRRALSRLRGELERVGLDRESVRSLVSAPVDIETGLDQEARTFDLCGTDSLEGADGGPTPAKTSQTEERKMRANRKVGQGNA